MCVRKLPCRNGSFIVDKELFDTNTHTYPNMIIELSLNQLRNFLCINPGKQRYRKNIKEQIDWWLSGDDERGKYRKKYAAKYDIAEFESSSVIDEEGMI